MEARVYALPLLPCGQAVALLLMKCFFYSYWVRYIAESFAESIVDIAVSFGPGIVGPISFYYFFTNKVILRAVKRV